MNIKLLTYILFFNKADSEPEKVNKDGQGKIEPHPLSIALLGLDCETKREVGMNLVEPNPTGSTTGIM